MACASFLHPNLSINSYLFTSSQKLQFPRSRIQLSHVWQYSVLRQSRARKAWRHARSYAWTADMEWTIPSPSVDRQSSVLLAVEDCEDGSRIFKYGSRDEQEALRSVELLRETGESLEDEAVNWTFSTNGAAGENGEGLPTKQGEGGESDGAHEEMLEETMFVPADVCLTFEGEEEPEVRCPLRLEAAVSSIPHPARTQRGGEDAHFILENWVGVADGISGWAELGINSGLYSRELMWNCMEVIRSGEKGFDPKAVIEESHSRIDLQGSCTATVAVLEGQTLRVSNLGDSAFALIRMGQMLLRSRSMQHSFNVPFQIGTSGGDDPLVAEDYSVEVQSGDIILLGTDGLFDNVFEDVIAGTLTQAYFEAKGPEAAAKQLALVAQRQSLLPSGSTPFREDARAAGLQHDGGKKDDITVLVAYVQ